MEKELKEKFIKSYNESKYWLINNSKFKKEDLVLFKYRLLDTVKIGKIIHIEANPINWKIQYRNGRCLSIWMDLYKEESLIYQIREIDGREIL